MADKMSYNVFLFYQLYCLFDIEFSKQPYDWQFDAIQAEYEKYKESEFDDPDTNLYECIVEYLHSKQTKKEI